MFPASVIEHINHARREKLASLDLSGHNLKSLPAEIWELRSLETLYLSGNELESLPSNIGRLRNLSSIFLTGNRLKSLPEEFIRLRYLKSLNLGKNNFTELPKEITRLSGLQTLQLYQNNISNLPPEIGELKNLSVLNLGGNSLLELPHQICELKKLKCLYLGSNSLHSIPSSISNLKKLRVLDLRKNKFTHLPQQLFTLKLSVELDDNSEKKELNLYGNPLESPPLEVALQGRKSILAYFEEIKKEETARIFEAKLIVVGQGNVGKTYLKQRIMHDSINPSTVSTEGIDIDSWIIETKKTDSLRANFWDFGGQEIYHATHQFFLTKRSLYLFVWEARTDDDLVSFDYWLNTINILSDGSPIIVIQNKIDERKKAINRDGWQKRFPNIVDYHDVSATIPLGIDALKFRIVSEIDELPHIGDLLPKRWLDIRRNLEELEEPYISYSFYRNICQQYGMTDVQAERLSEYYHDLGVFLHFKDNHILRSTIFLQPEWATNAVYAVTDDPNVRDNYGHFYFEDP